MIFEIPGWICRVWHAFLLQNILGDIEGFPTSTTDHQTQSQGQMNLKREHQSTAKDISKGKTFMQQTHHATTKPSPTIYHRLSQYSSCMFYIPSMLRDTIILHIIAIWKHDSTFISNKSTVSTILMPGLGLLGFSNHEAALPSLSAKTKPENLWFYDCADCIYTCICVVSGDAIISIHILWCWWEGGQWGDFMLHLHSWAGSSFQRPHALVAQSNHSFPEKSVAQSHKLQSCRESESF